MQPEQGAEPTTTSEAESQELQEQSTGDEAPEVEEAQHETDEQHVEPSQEEPEAPESTPQEPAPAIEGDDVSDDAFVPQPIQTPTFAPPNAQDFVDAAGNFDIAGYQQKQSEWSQQVQAAAISAAAQTAANLTKYQQDWQKAEDKYPELKNNRQLRDMVQAIHANSAQPGFKYLSPQKAADQLFGIRNQAKVEGIQAAKETRTVQQAATLAQPNPPAPAQRGDKVSQLKEQMRSGKTAELRKAAGTEIIKNLLESGQL